MIKRPMSVTLLAVYLIGVFGVSFVGDLYGAVATIEPYAPQTWLLIAVPKLLAVAAGFALWRMRKVGAWLLAASIVGGWVLAVVLSTGFFPSLSTAFVVSIVFAGVSAWVVMSNWGRMLPNGGHQVGMTSGA